MVDTKQTQRIASKLEAAGKRVTQARLAVVAAVVAAGRRPFTGEDLYARLSSSGVGRATVFRSLKLLLSVGVLTRLHLVGGCQQYILSEHGAPATHHDRLICRLCGHIVYLDCCPMTESLAQIAAQSGYELASHRVDILGLCANCRPK